MTQTRIGGFASIISLISMLEAGMVVLTYRDLLHIPATFFTCWSIFRDVKEEIKKGRTA